MNVAFASTVVPDEVCTATARRVRELAAAAPAHPIAPAVAEALTSIDRQVPGHLTHWPDGIGGAHAFIDCVNLGAPYTHEATWVAFHVPHTLPDGDIYPVWLRPDLARPDGSPIGKVNAMGQNFMHTGQTWLTEAAVMVSLRSSDRDPNIDAPARKLARVLATVRNA